MERKMFLVVGLVLCVAGAANAAIITDTSQLDLTNVVKALNFWAADTTVGGVTFLATGVPGSGTGTVDGVTNDATWGAYGAIPVGTTGPDSVAFEGLYNGSIYASDVINFTTDLGNGDYKIQVLLYEQWDQAARDVTLTAEGDSAVETMLSAPTANSFGQILELTTTVTDGALNFSVSQDPLPANVHIGGLFINQVPEPMTMALLGLGGLFLRRRKR